MYLEILKIILFTPDLKDERKMFYSQFCIKNFFSFIIHKIRTSGMSEVVFIRWDDNIVFSSCICVGYVFIFPARDEDFKIYTFDHPSS